MSKTSSKVMTERPAEAATDATSDPAAMAARWALIETAFDHLDDGFSVFDGDLCLVAWNRRFFELVDVPVEGFARVGTPFEAFMRFNAERGEYGPGDVDVQVAERVARARAFVSHCFERERPTGQILEIRGNPLPGGGFVTVYKDITDQRRAERALKESHEQLENRVAQRTAELQALNERLIEEMAERKRAHEALREREEWIRLIADTVPALIGYVDSDRRYRFANRQYESWFGLGPEDIIGRPVEEVLGAEQYRNHRRYVEAALAGQRANWEFPFVTPDGRRIQTAASFIPHVDENGSVLGYVVLGQDVTDQRQAEAVMRQAQKMEAIGQLTGGLSHDFNNLLTIIIGNLGVLAEQVGDDSTVRSLLDPALGAARRGAGLVKRLLAFARRQPLQPRVVDVERLVGGMTELLDRALGGAIEIAFDLKGESWPVRADPHQLENAILNLAINARDAMPEGGRVVIATANRCLESEAAARHPDATPGDHVVVSVADNGTGMAPEVVERAFEPFYTTKAHGGGSGLGLSMVYGFIRQSDGHVEIDSAPGAGTTVRLYLPRATDVHAAEGEPATVADIPGGDERILVVEDDEEVRQVTVIALDALGYRVQEAADGAAALALLEDISAVDLIVTDVEMPGPLDGVELAAEVRARRGRTPVLYVSGYSDKMAPGRTADGGLCLAKPFGKGELARAVREVLDGPGESAPEG
jgi:PAS domain S-box-containing protein